MRVLADTHSLVWALESPSLLSAPARLAMQNSEVLASAVNLWELFLKAGKPGSVVARPLDWWEKYIVRTGIRALSIRVIDVIALGQLPEIHKDPFDRILIAQAKVERIPLISKDAHLARYGVAVIW